MSKKTICSAVRIVEMTVALTILQQAYQIGWFGCFIVTLTGFVWAVTADIEHTK